MPRTGYLTPSSFADLMTNGRKSDEMGKTALAVVDKLTLDLIGAERPEETTPPSCEWGKENEWSAIEAYKEERLCDVVTPEFRVSATHPYIGGTMDGLVGARGGIEVKCPYNRTEHLANLTDGKQIEQYMFQMQGYMFIYELDWIDFVSYDPRFPEEKQLYVKRVLRDEAIIHDIVKRCEQAYAMALVKVDKLGNSA